MLHKRIHWHHNIKQQSKHRRTPLHKVIVHDLTITKRDWHPWERLEALTTTDQQPSNVWGKYLGIYILSKTHTKFQKHTIVKIIKHMAGYCFAFLRSGLFGNVNFGLYQKILQEYIQPSAENKDLKNSSMGNSIISF